MQPQGVAAVPQMHLLAALVITGVCIIPHDATGFPITINGTEYTYNRPSTTTSLSFEQASTICTNLGSEWVIASCPTTEVDALFDNVPSYMFYNGLYNFTTGNRTWTYGRMAGTVFSQWLKKDSQEVTYSNWNRGEPNAADCHGSLQTYVAKRGSLSTSWDDVWERSDTCGIENKYEVKCTSCERSPCVMSDCPRNNRLRPSYYPSCLCETLTATLALTASGTLTSTASPPQTMSPSTTATPTPTSTISRASVSTTPSPSHTPSGATLSLSVSPTHLTPTYSTTATYSPSHASPSMSPTPTTSMTTSNSMVVSATLSFSSSPKPSPSLTPSFLTVSTTASSTTALSSSMSSSHSSVPFCHTFVPTTLYHYSVKGIASTVNTSCASQSLTTTPRIPIQALWLGSGMDPTTNTTGSEVSVSTLRTMMMTSSCPVLPPPPFAPVEVGHAQWSTGSVTYLIGGGQPTHPSPDGSVPPWVFSTLLPQTVPTVNSLLTYSATYDNGGEQVAVVDAASKFAVEVVAVPADSEASNGTTSSLGVRVTYIGVKSLSGFVVTVDVPAAVLLVCVGPETIALSIDFKSRTLLVDTEAVADGVATSVSASSGVTGSPGGVVRGGVLSSLSNLLKCEAPDLTQPISLLANPFNIAVGRAEGQYYRGGIVSGLLLLVGLSVVFCGLMIPAKMVSLHKEYKAAIKINNAEHSGDDDAALVMPPPTWADALAHTHLPGMMIVPMSITGESWVPNGVTLMTMPNRDALDVVVGVAATMVFGAYLVHLLFTTIRVDTVRVRRLAVGSGKKDRRPEGGVRRIVMYWLDSPVVLVPHGLPNDELLWTTPTRQQYGDLTSYEATCQIGQGGSGPLVRENMRWLLRYGPYVDELNVLWFKAVELALGNVINVVDGIITDSCFVQGFTIVAVVTAVLAIMVIKKPLAVPAQQLTTSIVYGSMFVASIVVVANLFAQDPQVQDIASVLFLISTTFTIVQTATDMLISLVAAQLLVSGLLRRRRKLKRLRRNDQMMANDHELHLVDLGTDDASSGEESDADEEVRDDEPSKEAVGSMPTEREVQGTILAELEEEDRRVEAARLENERLWLDLF